MKYIILVFCISAQLVPASSANAWTANGSYRGFVDFAVQCRVATAANEEDPGKNRDQKNASEEEEPDCE